MLEFGVTSYPSDSIVYGAPSDALYHAVVKSRTPYEYMTKESSNFLMERCASAYIFKIIFFLKKKKCTFKHHFESFCFDHGHISNHILKLVREESLM
jgi:hypothetical protein